MSTLKSLETMFGKVIFGSMKTYPQNFDLLLQTPLDVPITCSCNQGKVHE